MSRNNTRNVEYLKQEARVYKRGPGRTDGYILEYATRPGTYVTRQNSMFKPGYLGDQMGLAPQERVLFFVEKCKSKPAKTSWVEAVVECGIVKLA